VPIIPAAIAGAFDAWPRNQKLPNLFPDGKNIIRIIFGEPIAHETSTVMSDDELNAYVENRVKELYEQIRGL